MSTKQKDNVPMQPEKTISPKKIALIILVITLLWVGSGYIFGTSLEAETSESLSSQTDLSKILKVEALEAKPFRRTVVVNGITEANRSVALKPEVEGKVVELPVKKGSFVEAGQVIVRLDERDRREKLNQAKAKLEQYKIEYAASQELESKGYRPKIGLAASKANLETARLDVAQSQLAVDNMLVKAPFAGRLEELNVEVGDYVLAGFMGSFEKTTMARIVEDNPLLVSSNISEKDLPFIKPDNAVRVVLSDGRELEGKIKFISQYADSASRSFRVEALVDNADHAIPVGMTATLHLPANQGSAYLVSSSTLALDDTGKVGVKIINDEGVVEFLYVTILDNIDEGVWIGGLPDKVNLITQGQAFANAGQTLDVKAKPPQEPAKSE